MGARERMCQARTLGGMSPIQVHGRDYIQHELQSSFEADIIKLNPTTRIKKQTKKTEKNNKKTQKKTTTKKQAKKTIES